MRQSLNRTCARVSWFVRNQITNPAIDVTGANVLGLYAGRTFVNSTFAITAYGLQMYPVASLIALYILFDSIVHFHVLQHLQKLMKYEIANEIISRNIHAEMNLAY